MRRFFKDDANYVVNAARLQRSGDDFENQVR